MNFELDYSNYSCGKLSSVLSEQRKKNCNPIWFESGKKEKSRETQSDPPGHSQ